ncbi:MAG: hypothetical protein QOE24_621 [Frankiales bacterium]|jgi:hypothetical protein|nr:hypothetical protein [Frankiales bacterium]MDX6208230.1 hypothetical protein [Frankiales bacterium]MDX6222247.1 hypothetical protein [Frankiales bacterium]
MSLLTEPVVVVQQRAKVFSQRAEYDLYTPSGEPLGSVAEQPGSGKWLLGNLAHLRLVVADAEGQPVLLLDKPGSWARSRFGVLDAHETLLGEMNQENILFAPQFALWAADGSTGRLDGGRMWSWEWTIEGAGGQPLGRVTKHFAGLAEMFTSADNYVVELSPDLTGPLRAVGLTACVCLDVVRDQAKRNNSG